MSSNSSILLDNMYGNNVFNGPICKLLYISSIFVAPEEVSSSKLQIAAGRLCILMTNPFEIKFHNLCT